MSKLWWVHIQGPDDLIEADGMLDAMRKAHANNAVMLQHLETRGTPVTEYSPLVWATPIRPGDETTAHITDDSKVTP